MLLLTKNQLFTLSNIFSPTIIRELLKFGYSNKLLRILEETKLLDKSMNKKLFEVYEMAYGILKKEYPNEYIYKNILTNKILLGTHSLNTSFLLTEFRANNSKVDCVIINGTLTVYEIKTKFDTFQRLVKQLNDYKKVFEKIYVITDEINIEKLNFLKKDGIGLKRLNVNGTISTIYEAQSQFNNLDLSVIFDSLRQKEYLMIIDKLCGDIPNVPNTEIYRVSKDIFSKIDKEKAYIEVVKVLKQRGKSQKLKEFIKDVPKSLKVRAVEINLTNKSKLLFLNILDMTISNLLARGQKCTIHI